MHVEGYDPGQVVNLIDEANNIAVIASKVAGKDAFAAGAGLYYMLTELGKDVKFIYPWKVPNGCEDVLREFEISADISNRELLVSIDYSGTEAAKANYSTVGDVLNVKIGPVSKDFDKGKVKTKIVGYDFDLIFILGAQELFDLGSVSHQLDKEINKSKIINIDITSKNKRYGVVNVVEPYAQSLSELVFKKASEWKLVPEKRAAKALLYGMAD
jgi:nanoRNase/pAp phosphatase (c-di-AMP/oligoRNAs hydrolase)